MNKTWWAVATGSVLGGAVLVGLGFYLFEPNGFLENLLAEAIGLLVALAVIIVLIEGPILTRQKRIREILEYRRQVFQAAGATAPLIAQNIAQPIADEFQPPTDLYGPERGKWDEFEPLLRQVFRQAMAVRQNGLPDYDELALDEGYARSIMQACLDMERRSRQAMETNPEFASWDVLGSFDMTLRQIVNHVERAQDLDIPSDTMERYREMGELGDLLLDLIKGAETAPQTSELW